MTYIMDMYKDSTDKVNVAMVKEHLSAYVARVEQGERIMVCRRNTPVADLIPIKARTVKNRTCLGSAKDSVKIKCDLTEPVMSESAWEMLT